MSSGRGIDPCEPEAMQFVITESLLSLGVIPQIHLGTNFTVVDMTRHTIIAVVETGESEPSFSIEVKKAELSGGPSCSNRRWAWASMFRLQALVARLLVIAASLRTCS